MHKIKPADDVFIFKCSRSFSPTALPPRLTTTTTTSTTRIPQEEEAKCTQDGTTLRCRNDATMTDVQGAASNMTNVTEIHLDSCRIPVLKRLEFGGASRLRVFSLVNSGLNRLVLYAAQMFSKIHTYSIQSVWLLFITTLCSLTHNYVVLQIFCIYSQFLFDLFCAHKQQVLCPL